MGKCDNCRLRKESAKAFDIHWLGEDDCPYDKCPVPDFPKTNADRIRAMTDEELAVKLAGNACPPNHKNPITECEVTGHPCYECWLDWLRREVDYGKAD